MRLHITCPACRTIYNTPWECLGKKVRCDCGASFVIPEAPRSRHADNPATTPVAQEPVVRPAQLEEVLQPVLIALAQITDQVTATADLLPNIQELSNRKVMEELYEESVNAWKAEKTRMERRIHELEGGVQELKKQNQRLETASKKRTDDFSEVLADMLPDLEFLEGSIPFIEELTEPRHVLRVLGQLQHTPDLLQMTTFESAPGWKEITRHISSGQSNDVRVYVKKGSGKIKFRVLVSRKGCQDRDKKRMQDAG